MCSVAEYMMDDPPPPYSSIDESKYTGYPPKYPTGPPLQNQYGDTSYPAPDYYGTPHSGIPNVDYSSPGTASSFYPASAPQPPVIIAPAPFSRLNNGMHSLRQKYSTYSTHILLSCFVTCCCGPVGLMCGLLAFCFAICAQSFVETSPQLARLLRTTSMALSLAGIAVGLATVVLVVYNGGFKVHSQHFTAAGNNTLDECPYPIGGRCFNERKLVRSVKSCYDGYYSNGFCYYREEQI